MKKEVLMNSTLIQNGVPMWKEVLVDTSFWNDIWRGDFQSTTSLSEGHNKPQWGTCGWYERRFLGGGTHLALEIVCLGGRAPFKFVSIVRGSYESGGGWLLGLEEGGGWGVFGEIYL